MVMYALHFALRDVLLESQYPVGDYFIDGYFPDLRLAVEIDEAHHKRTNEEDVARQSFIERELNCEFIRINVVKDSIYEQVDHIVNLVRERVLVNKIAAWEHVIPEGNTGDFTAVNLSALEKNGTYLFTERFRAKCVSHGLDVVDCDISGHIPEGNGYLGFLVNLSTLQLSVSITKTHKPKLLVTRRDEDLIQLLNLNLSGPRKNGEYFVIHNFEGRHDQEEVLDFLLLLKSKIDER
jgi:very-short-patch-repair endonuclease